MIKNRNISFFDSDNCKYLKNIWTTVQQKQKDVSKLKLILSNEFYKKNKNQEMSECILSIENFNLYYIKKEKILGFIDLKTTTV